MQFDCEFRTELFLSCRYGAIVVDIDSSFEFLECMLNTDGDGVFWHRDTATLRRGFPPLAATTLPAPCF